MVSVESGIEGYGMVSVPPTLSYTDAPGLSVPTRSTPPQVGFAWDSADERKLQRTFGFGRLSFPGFVDLQVGGVHIQEWGLLDLKRPLSILPYFNLPFLCRQLLGAWVTDTQALHASQSRYSVITDFA